MRQLSFFSLFLVAAACGAPSPPPHGPVPAPAPVIANPTALLADIRTSYTGAKLEPSREPDSITLVFGPGPAVASVDTFATTFLEAHIAHLGTGPLGASFGSDASDRVVRGAFGAPPRDSGCRRVRVVLELVALIPSRLERACERFTRAPPSYRGRLLPSTASGSVDVIARVGSIGGIAGPLFSGYAIDRFGDVYEARDPLPAPVGSAPPAFLREYVRTLLPAEVEQFAFDAARALREPELPDDREAIPDGGGAVVQAFVAGDDGRAGMVELGRRRGDAAERALRWARRATLP